MHIEDGSSNRVATVNTRHRLDTAAMVNSQQHVVSHEDGLAFQFVGDATEFAGVASVLWIENTHASKDLVVSYIRVQVMGTAATTLVPQNGKFFRINRNSSSRSGGAAITPVNMNFKSGLSASANAYTGNTAMTATPGSEFDRWYPNGSMMTYNKEGSVILGKGDILEISYTSTAASGATAYARVTGFYLSPDE